MNREFNLVTACCRWPPSPHRNAAIAAAAVSPIDWHRFLNVVKRHRVPGLVWNGLSQAGIETPSAITENLKAYADRTVRAGLFFCAETIRLQRLIDREGHQCAFVKGVTLSMLAYGNNGIRHAKDIDMVVPAAHLSAVCNLLGAAGYRRIRPAAIISQAQLALWQAYGKDMAWRHEHSGIELELHWRLTDLSFPRSEPLDFSALLEVEVTSSDKVMTLPRSDLFAYLCVHGAVHGWSRLKWLADINALIAAEPGAIAHDYAKARANGMERAMGQALLLCGAVFGLRLPDALAAELRSSLAATALAKIGLISMTRGQAEVEVYDQAFGTTLISASHLLLAKGLRFWVAEIRRKGINLDDVLDVPLPRGLAILYWFLRGPLWLVRRASNVGASYLHRRR